MKIIKLTAENIKKLTAVEITPDGAMVIISGKNGAGKSSVLDSIYWALSGTKNIDAQPIREGEESASIKLDLGEIVVTRKFNNSGTKLVVTSADGAQFPSPQKMLDELIGTIAFDPLAFADMPAKEQVKILSEVSGINVDFDEVDATNKTDYDERTVINRQAKALEVTIAAQKEAIGNLAPDAERKDIAELTVKYADARSLADKRANADAVVQRAAQDRQECVNRINALRKQLIDEESRYTALDQNLASVTKAAEAIAPPTHEKLAEMQQWIAKCEVFNQRIDKRDAMSEQITQLSELQEHSAKLTERIETRTQQAQNAVADAQMPVDGLSLTNKGVFYNGLPFEQINSAEKLKISTAIAMALNPKLRVIRIERGNDLDEDGLKMLSEIAAANDFQIWVEHIGKEPMSFHIEDGALA